MTPLSLVLALQRVSHVQEDRDAAFLALVGLFIAQLKSATVVLITLGGK